MKTTVGLRVLRFVVSVLVVLCSYSASATLSLALAAAQHPISVDDAISAARFASGALFSPDSRQFVAVSRKASLQNNQNVYSLFLFHTNEAFSKSTSAPLLTMSSSSNDEAISSLRWLADNQRIIFLGEEPGQLSQIYEFNVVSRNLEQITRSAGSVRDFAVTPDGDTILYTAQSNQGTDTQHTRNSIVLNLQSLVESIDGPTAPTKLFVQKRGGEAIEIPLVGNGSLSSISISPDGQYGFGQMGAYVQDLPDSWTQYSFPDNEYLRKFFRGLPGRSPFKRYLLLDLQGRTASELSSVPVLYSMPRGWRGHSVFVSGAYLPLEGVQASVREARRTNTYCVEIRLPVGEIREADQMACSESKQSSGLPEIQVREGLNIPPKLYAINPATKKESMLLDLNPQFSGLQFGNVENISWKANGIDVEGGLYFPQNYDPAKRYPLVIQTHGHDARSFSMDGRYEWTSGFAARPLAAQGFLVLQAFDWKDIKDKERVAANRSLGANEEEALKNFNVIAYESAVDDLDERGLIDRDRVGISGFSRTVCFVGSTLTHRRKRFAAATLTDGDDCSYFNYLSFPAAEMADDDNLNGGLAPITPEGLRQWNQRAPGFNLDNVNTPVRLVAIGPVAILENWEWFVGLSLRNRPVELIEIPSGVHLMQRPSDRKVAMQGIVDWYAFWLKGEEDPDPAKADQYKRWRGLKKLQEENDEKAKAGAQAN